MDQSLFLYFSNITLVISPQFIEAIKRTDRRTITVTVESTVIVIQVVVVQTATRTHIPPVEVPVSRTVIVETTGSKPFIITLPKSIS